MQTEPNPALEILHWNDNTSSVNGLNLKNIHISEDSHSTRLKLVLKKCLPTNSRILRQTSMSSREYHVKKKNKNKQTLH